MSAQKYIYNVYNVTHHCFSPLFNKQDHNGEESGMTNNKGPHPKSNLGGCSCMLLNYHHLHLKKKISLLHLGSHFLTFVPVFILIMITLYLKNIEI